MSSFRIKAIAKSVPQKVVTNDDLTKIMETSDEWIKRRTGIALAYIEIELQRQCVLMSPSNWLIKLELM